MKTLKDRTLFLDRDGVINVQLVGDYVKKVSELELREDFLKSIPLIVRNFGKVFIVTNQQCIAKGLSITNTAKAMQRSESACVVVHAHAFKQGLFTVQVKTVGTELRFTDSENRKLRVAERRA